jgi:putative Holliday junction resolvase
VLAIGIDPGQKRVGLAVCDEDGVIAMPRPAIVLKSPKAIAARIVLAARELRAEHVVMGLPIDMSGHEGLAAKKSRALAATLRTEGLAVVLWDERASTVAANRDLSRMGKSAKDARALVDSTAACLLLQSWLDAGPAARGGL